MSQKFQKVSRLALLFFFCATFSSARAATKPNIIFILADDLGYGDVGVFYQNSRGTNQPSFTTPKLDQMAAQGMLLRHHYTGAPVCAPARGSFLLGQHQGHCGVRDNQFDKALPNNHTVGTVLKQAGYRTAIIGKWGLAGQTSQPAVYTPDQVPGHPQNRGFDEFFGYVAHSSGHVYYHDSSHKLYEGFTEVTASYQDIYSTDLFTARAKQFISDQRATNSAQPFFLFLSPTAIHNALDVPGNPYPSGIGTNGGLQWPLAPTPTTKDTWLHPDYTNATGWTSNMKRYATMARRLDDGIGDILQLLRDLNIATNTIVVFSSDNGPGNEGGADPRNFDSWGPLDGLKRDCWEGGVREPTIAWWPGKISTNSICDFPSGFWDWMPTFAEISGVPSPAHSDGVSLLPSLTGAGAQRNRGYVYIEYFHDGSNSASTDVFARKEVTGRGQQQIIRIGGFVGVRVQVTNASVPLRLYNVMTDPHQDTNLATNLAYTNLLAQMKDLLMTVRRPEPSAARPYDSELLPAIMINLVTNGALDFSAYEGNWPWVPDFDSLTAVSTGKVAGFDLSARSRDTNCGIKFSGYIEVPADGTYTFYLTTDTGANVWIHDAQIIDDDFTHDGSEHSASINLKAGLHPIRLFYRHNTGSRILNFQWSSADFVKQSVPVSALYSSGNSPLPLRAFDDFSSTTQNLSVTINVLSNDRAGTSPISVQSVAAPKRGTTTIISGQIRYTPATNFLGEDSFSYTISDGQAISTAIVRVKVVFTDGTFWFPFNQVSGLITEESGGAATATLRGYTDELSPWVGGKFGRGLSFDGVDEYATIDNFSGILGTNARTMAAWIKTSNTNSSGPILGWGSRNNGAKWIWLHNATGQTRLEVESGFIVGTAIVNNGQWRHVACTFESDGTPNVTDAKFYVDGVLDTISSTSSRTINTAENGDVKIGSDVQSRYFDGRIDELRIYDRVLTASEIAALAVATNQSAAAWHRRYFGNAAINWFADDDGDKSLRLFEYAMGTEPLISDPFTNLFQPRIVNGHLHVTFPRRIAGTTEVTYQPQASRDFSNWLTPTTSEISATAFPQKPGFEEVIQQVDPDMNSEWKVFLRLKVGF
jgi:arylsulfatase A-like enzyme